MTAAWLALAWLSALALYLASPHQRWCRAALPRPRLARGVAWFLLICAGLVAGAALGPGPGVFAALSAWMLGLMLMPLTSVRGERT